MNETDIQAAVDDMLAELMQEGIAVSGDYIDADTGLLMCGKCRTKKQTVVKQIGRTIFVAYLFPAFLAPFPGCLNCFPKSLKVVSWYWSFCHIHSPYYILLFTFLFGYVYTVPINSLNNSYFCIETLHQFYNAAILDLIFVLYDIAVNFKKNKKQRRFKK